MALIRFVGLALLSVCLLVPPAQAWPLRPGEAGFAYYHNRSVDVGRGDLLGSGLAGRLGLTLHSGAWHRLDLGLEIGLGGFAGHGSGFEAALAPGLRLYLNPDGRWRPYLEAGAGISYNDLDIHELGTGFNFLTFAGLGLRLPLNEAISLDLGLRLRHISNAGLDQRNHGVTSHQLQAGLAWNF